MTLRATPKEYFDVPQPVTVQEPTPQPAQYYYYTIDYTPLIVIGGTLIFLGFLAFLAYLAKK